MLSKKAAVFAVLVLTTTLFPQALAAENIAELRINSITTPIKAGGRLDFAFTAGNKAGPPCPAEIQYWFGRNGETQGNDTFYLDSGQTLSEEISLIMPIEFKGVKQFYLEMKCNNATILASRVIEITEFFPVLPQLKDLEMSNLEEEKQVEFSYTVESNKQETSSIRIEERIVTDNNIAWVNSQNVPVAGRTEIKRFGPALPPGNYKLIVETTHGNETAKMTRDFSIKPAAPPAPSLLPAFLIAALFAVMLATAFVGTRYFATRRTMPKPVMPVEAEAGTPVEAEESVEEEGQIAEEKIKLFEAESSGVPPELEISQAIEMAGWKGNKRAKALENAGKTEVMQSVKSFIVISQGKKARFETTVRLSLANYTNRNWENILVLARIPRFLGKTISQVSEDTKVKAKKKGQLASFTLEKVGAMQSASFSYTVPKLVSQTEANSVPLPIVVSYIEGEPLIITQVKVEKKAEEKAEEENVEKFYSKIEAEEKNAKPPK